MRITRCSAAAVRNHDCASCRRLNTWSTVNRPTACRRRFWRCSTFTTAKAPPDWHTSLRSRTSCPIPEQSSCRTLLTSTTIRPPQNPAIKPARPRRRQGLASTVRRPWRSTTTVDPILSALTSSVLRHATVSLPWTSPCLYMTGGQEHFAQGRPRLLRQARKSISVVIMTGRAHALEDALLQRPPDPVDLDSEGVH